MTLLCRRCICIKNSPFIAERSFISVIYGVVADFIFLYRPRAGDLDLLLGWLREESGGCRAWAKARKVRKRGIGWA